MVGKTHVAGALAFASLSSLILKNQIPEGQLLIHEGITLTMATITALFPDIDHKGSTVSRKNPIISFFCRLFLTHRGFTHSPLALLLFTGSVFYICNMLGNQYILWGGTGASIGYASHILLDAFNPKGVPLFYPYKKKFSFGKIVTGTWAESLVLFISIGIFVICEGMLFGYMNINFR